MTTLDMEYIAASPRQLKPHELTAVSTFVVYPEAPIDVIQRSGIDLDGFDLSDAFDYVHLFHMFLNSDASEEYRQAFRPDTLYVHPCRPKSDPLKVANALRDNGLNVCLVGGVHEITSSFGFMLTASKRDFSADIASAYLLAGNVPPQELLLRGLERNAHGPLESLYQQAAAQAIRHYSECVDRLEQFVDPDFSSAMAP